LFVFEVYLDLMTTQVITPLKDLMDMMFDQSEKIDEGSYLKMNNLLKEIYQKVSNDNDDDDDDNNDPFEPYVPFVSLSTIVEKNRRISELEDELERQEAIKLRVFRDFANTNKVRNAELRKQKKDYEQLEKAFVEFVENSQTIIESKKDTELDALLSELSKFK